jgi:hypothetical protein
MYKTIISLVLYTDSEELAEHVARRDVRGFRLESSREKATWEKGAHVVVSALCLRCKRQSVDVT